MPSQFMNICWKFPFARQVLYWINVPFSLERLQDNLILELANSIQERPCIEHIIRISMDDTARQNSYRGRYIRYVLAHKQLGHFLSQFAGSPHWIGRCFRRWRLKLSHAFLSSD